MNFTQEQISEIMFEIASEKDGYNKLLKLSFDTIMKNEQLLYKEENEDGSVLKSV